MFEIPAFVITTDQIVIWVVLESAFGIPFALLRLTPRWRRRIEGNAAASTAIGSGFTIAIATTLFSPAPAIVLLVLASFCLSGWANFLVNSVLDEQDEASRAAPHPQTATIRPALGDALHEAEDIARRAFGRSTDDDRS